jgi:glucose/arabinose dehydrogenase
MYLICPAAILKLYIFKMIKALPGILFANAFIYRLCIKNGVFISMILAGFTGCRQTPLPPGDKDNGGLMLPGGVEAAVVADSIGRARHIAVNDNGDIYVKLTFNDVMHGSGGTAAIRDNNNDGKADIIAYFGDYKDEGGLPAGISIHNGYLYTSTVKNVFRNKLRGGLLIPDSKTETILTDTDTNLMRHWHTAKPFAFDDAGNMYVPFGAPTDAAQDVIIAGPAGIPGGKGLDPAPELENHAGIWRFDDAKKNQTQKDGYKYATGIRSVLGITWNTADNSLYAVVNGMDNFHTRYPGIYTSWQAAVLPSEPLLKVKEQGNYGGHTLITISCRGKIFYNLVREWPKGS